MLVVMKNDATEMQVEAVIQQIQKMNEIKEWHLLAR